MIGNYLQTILVLYRSIECTNCLIRRYWITVRATTEISGLLNTERPLLVWERAGKEGGTAIDPAPAPASLGDVSADERELLTAFRALNATGRDVLLGTARGLYQNPAMREDGGSDAATTA